MELSRHLPPRAGPRPRTSTTIPHQQLDQQPTDPQIPQRFAQQMFTARPHAHQAPSRISVPGATALILDDDAPAGSAHALLADGEFAHLHPSPDYSLHLALPADLAARVAAAGWGEPHIGVASGSVPPTILMLYAPRDDQEIDVVLALVEQSYRFAINHSPPITEGHNDHDTT